MPVRKATSLLFLTFLVGCTPTQQNDVTVDETVNELTSAENTEEPKMSESGAARYIRQEEFQAPFGQVLIGEYGYAEGDAGHSTAGRLDVSYIVDGKARRSFRKAVEVGSNGRLAEWDISYNFTNWPVIYASGGFTNMGATEGCTILSELRPSGPHEIAVIPDYSGGTSIDGEEYETEDKIEAIEKGEGFEVVYRGSDSGTVL